MAALSASASLSCSCISITSTSWVGQAHHTKSNDHPPVFKCPSMTGLVDKLYFFLILHPSPLRLGVPNAFPSLSAVVSILKFDLSQPKRDSTPASGNHHP